jgi:glucose/arabinose dehydrogenase
MGFCASLSVSRRAGALAVVAALVAAGTAACGGGNGGDDDGLANRSTESEPDETTAPADEAPAEAPLDSLSLALTPAFQANAPIAVTARPDSDVLYVAERTGTVRPVTGDTVGDPILDLSDEVVTAGEQGLLDVEFSNDGKTLYVSYSIAPKGDSRVVAYTMDGEAVDTASRRELLAVEQPFANHNGGDVEIGPDGYLYFGLGDGGAAGDPFGNGQNTSVLLGKILRIDPTTPSAGKNYSIPPDNPFADGQGGAPEVWAYGVRNPWRYTFDAKTDDLWIGDVGQNQWEEIDLLPAADGGGKGVNLGWDQMEATHPYKGGTNPPGAVLPVYEYSHDDGCSVTGGIVYRGTAIPGLGGAFLFSDYCQGTIRALRTSGDQTTEEHTYTEARATNVVSFGVDNNGEVYVVSLDGPVYRLGAA